MAKPTDPLIFDETGGAERQIARLSAIMDCLRDPEAGCPWDIEQDFASIAPYTIEEAHEVADAIARNAWDELEGELGDLLLQVIYHSQMGREAGHFDLASVARAINAKMVARHPHVFGGENRDKSADQQTEDWERIKAAERGPAGVLDGVALGLPALTRAIKLQRRAARVGFDWPSTDEVIDKIREEAEELAEARHALGPEAIAEEFGDLLFVMVNLGRHLGVDSEAALRAANAKFYNRFRFIEGELEAIGKRPAESDLAEMDALWNKAKARGIR
ncbi:MAG: nucleoside triphosphate pyrophosphohydrolase [Paracoccaceae bacterium]